ncbi:MAG: AEC family transporter, partial [Faecalibacillus sp.]
KSDDSFHFNAQQLLTPGIILLFVAVFIYVFDIQLPPVILETINSVGGLTSPLSMMMIGSSLALYPMKESLTDWRSYLFAGVRLLFMPFITMVICRLLHIDPYYANIAIVTNAMPVASMVLMMATQYNANKEIVTRNIIVSTLLSVISIPVVVATMLL